MIVKRIIFIYMYQFNNVLNLSISVDFYKHNQYQTYLIMLPMLIFKYLYNAQEIVLLYELD